MNSEERVAADNKRLMSKHKLQMHESERFQGQGLLCFDVSSSLRESTSTHSICLCRPCDFFQNAFRLFRQFAGCSSPRLKREVQCVCFNPEGSTLQENNDSEGEEERGERN